MMIKFASRRDPRCRALAVNGAEYVEGIWVAIIGFASVVIGAAISEVRHWRKDRAVLRREKQQKKRLDELLAEPGYEFRRLKTLMHAIAADENTTVRLLIEIDARPSTDGQPLWKKASKKPDQVNQVE